MADTLCKWSNHVIITLAHQPASPSLLSTASALSTNFLHYSSATASPFCRICCLLYPPDSTGFNSGRGCIIKWCSFKMLLNLHVFKNWMLKDVTMKFPLVKDNFADTCVYADPFALRIVVLADLAEKCCGNWRNYTLAYHFHILYLTTHGAWAICLRYT